MELQNLQLLRHRLCAGALRPLHVLCLCGKYPSGSAEVPLLPQFRNCPEDVHSLRLASLRWTPDAAFIGTHTR